MLGYRGLFDLADLLVIFPKWLPELVINSESRRYQLCFILRHTAALMAKFLASNVDQHCGHEVCTDDSQPTEHGATRDIWTEAKMDPLTIRRRALQIHNLFTFTTSAQLQPSRKNRLKPQKRTSQRFAAEARGAGNRDRVYCRPAGAKRNQAKSCRGRQYQVQNHRYNYRHSCERFESFRMAQPARRREGRRGCQCREKIQSYLTGSMRARPDVDLNSYYILALNKSADISVIDPLLGFGGSKLLTLVMMKSPGEDWVLTKDGEKLFVTLPAINQVAVIETRSWKVANYIDTGAKPTSITLQPDQKYVWIGHEGNEPAASGVTVIDTATLKVVAQFPTGAGPHEIVISSDNRFAFVSNRESKTVSIVDVQKLAKINDVKVGPNPVSLALSELSKAIYAVSETDGTVAVIDQKGQLLTRIKAKPGARLLRFAPGGRYGFVLNTKAEHRQYLRRGLEPHAS